MIAKIKEIIFQAKKKEVLKAYELWEVRWTKRLHESFNPNGEMVPECEVFTNKEDAKRFKKRLLGAFKLVRNTTDDHVELIKK